MSFSNIFLFWGISKGYNIVGYHGEKENLKRLSCGCSAGSNFEVFCSKTFFQKRLNLLERRRREKSTRLEFWCTFNLETFTKTFLIFKVSVHLVLVVSCLALAEFSWFRSQWCWKYRLALKDWKLSILFCLLQPPPHPKKLDPYNLEADINNQRIKECAWKTRPKSVIFIDPKNSERHSQKVLLHITKMKNKERHYY